jgi:threonine/homoserine/homoserine lactone efflux protein
VTDVHLIAFVAVTALITVTPGVDMALVTKNAVAGGRRAALATALGVNAGVAVWIAASALGIATMVRESATAFAVLKIAGALYLTVLGVRLLRGCGGAAPAPTGGPSRSCFCQGVVNNLLNPKMGIVFVSLVPQFVDRSAVPPVRWCSGVLSSRWASSGSARLRCWPRGRPASSAARASERASTK